MSVKNSHHPPGLQILFKELLEYLGKNNTKNYFTELDSRINDALDLSISEGYIGLFELFTMLRNNFTHLSKSGCPADIITTLFTLLDDFISSPDKSLSSDLIINWLESNKDYFAIGSNELTMLKDILGIANTTDDKSEIVSTMEDNIFDSVSNVPELTSTREIITPKGLPSDTCEMFTIMQSELVSIENSLLVLLNLTAPDIKADFPEAQISESLGLLENYADAVRSFEFEGIALLINHIHENLAKITPKTKSTIKNLEEMCRLTDNLFSYLQNPLDKNSIDQIKQTLSNKNWKKKPEKELLVNLDKYLTLDIKAVEKTPVEKKIISPDDIDLSIPEDISSDLLDALLEELPGQIETLSSTLAKLGSSPTLEDIQVAKRISHTLKGAANTVGIKGVATLTHNMEDILLALYKSDQMPDPPTLAILNTASDCLASMGDFLLNLGPEPVDSVDVLQKVVDLSWEIETNGYNPDYSATVPIEAGSVNSKESAVAEKPVQAAEPVKSVKVPVTAIEELMNLAGELIIGNKQSISTLKDTINQIKFTQTLYQELRVLSDKIEEIITTQGVMNIGDVRSGNFDSLEFESYSDLHILIQQLIEKTIDADESTNSFLENLGLLHEKLINIGLINTDIKDKIQNNRLVSVSTQAARLQRIARQAANLLNKKVDFTLVGENSLIDSDILNNIIDCLIHIIRNAIDHGIEDADTRVANGKNEAGSLKITFNTSDTEVIVLCEDDGTGLNRESILRKAIDLKIIKEGDQVEDNFVDNLIFHSDFSTKSDVTQISGRGIGLDAVSDLVNQLSGNISVTSNPGNGTTFIIKIPTNLMIINTLMVGVGQFLVALSTRGIKQIYFNEQVEYIYKDENLESIRIDSVNYPPITLESLLIRETDRRSNRRNIPIVILYNCHDNKVNAILVDRIIGSEKMVLKGLGPYVPKINGIMGVSILGAGELVPVIDIVDFVQNRESLPDNYTRRFRKKKKLPTALIVDDSLSVRRVLIDFMHDLGYQVRAANDGLQAYEIATNCKPDIIITDMEMPRMDGLELASHIRSNEMLKETPIIMITSRSTHKHKTEAEEVGINAFLTKPFSDDELLELVKSLNFNL